MSHYDRSRLILADKEAFTLGEAAAVYGVDEDELRTVVQTGAIPSDYRGKSWNILRSHLEDYYRAHHERATRERRTRSRKTT